MIFVDTSFWVALRNRRDRHHAETEALLRGIGGEQLVTSNHVRSEAWTWLRREVGYQSSVGFLDELARSERVEVVHVDPELERRALTWLRKRPDREYSFVDATSFVLMRSMRIRDALAFDGDFTAAGFRELQP
jgi:predicted nucleic acid-binding protein